MHGQTHIKKDAYSHTACGELNEMVLKQESETEQPKNQRTQ